MHGELARVMAQQRGFFYRWQALDCGYKEKEVAALVRAREWHRIRRGAYAPRAVVESLDAAGRHVLTARAVVGNLEGLVVVTHHSSLAVQGVPLWGVDLGQVHVHRADGQTSRRDAGVVHHLGALPDSQVREVEGLLVASPERSVVDCGRTVPFEAGVVLADGAARLLALDMEVAEKILDDQRDWTGSLKAGRVLRFCDGLAATVGESRCRVLMARIGLPKPTLQKSIHDRRGTLLGITDFYVEEFDTAGEFDGKKKYGRALYETSGRLDDVDLGEVVWQEKRREDSIRDEGNEMVRVVWSELDGHDAVVKHRYLAAFERFTRRRPAG